MTVVRRQYVGTASPTRLSAAMAIGDTTFTAVAGGGTGYPTGTNPFVITVDAGTSAEEKILCASRTGDTFTVATSGRGFDGTAAQAHASGAAVIHSISAVDMDQVNQHGADTTQDDHTQYLNNARHDITARHAFGAALGTPAAASTSAVGDAAAAGTGTVPARTDHVHGREAYVAPAAETSFGIATATGAAAGVNHPDHKHGTPPLPLSATVATSESTNSAAYGDLTTAGPAVGPVTIGPSGSVLVFVTATLTANGAGTTAGAFMGFAVSGTDTVAAADSQCLQATSTSSVDSVGATAVFLVTGLTPGGSDTFTAKYHSSGTTPPGTFANRRLMVWPL